MLKYLEKENKEKLPIRLSYMAFRSFEEKNGISLLGGEKSLGEMKLQDLAALLFYGLKSGFAKEKKEFNMEMTDVEELLEDEPNLIVQLVRLLPEFVKQFTGGDEKNLQPLPKPSRPKKK